MLDFIAYVDAQRRTTQVAREALPDSPVRSDAARSRRAYRVREARRRASTLLYRVADLLAPVPGDRRYEAGAPAGAERGGPIGPPRPC